MIENLHIVAPIKKWLELSTPTFNDIGVQRIKETYLDENARAAIELEAGKFLALIQIWSSGTVDMVLEGAQSSHSETDYHSFSNEIGLLEALNKCLTRLSIVGNV